MDSKLVMLIGACPGAGKSTLSAFFAEQLKLNDLDPKWFYEEAVLYEPSLMPLLEKARGDKILFAQAVLEAAQEFTWQALNSNQIYVTDSLFPGFQWLIEKGCSLEELKTFSQELQTILQPLKPVLIYLNCNILLTLERAFKHRGDGYLEDMFENMRREDSRKNMELTVEDIINYWETNNQLSLELLTEWREVKLILNTTELPQAVCENLILKQFGLERQEKAKVEHKDLQIFAGQYLKKDPSSGGPDQITINLEAGSLKANLYWPAGCKLVARSETRFQLENIAQYIDFQLSPSDRVESLSYNEGSSIYDYVKKVL